MSIFKKNLLELNQSQVSGIVACALLGTFFIFMAGYYWGKKSAVEHFSSQFEQDSFADRIYSSMCLLYETPESESEKEIKEITEESQPRESVDYN